MYGGLRYYQFPRFFIEEELASGKLVEVLADYRQQSLDLHVVYPNRRHLAAKVTAFIDFIHQLNLCRTTP